jgi:hypothetical protein
MANWVATTVAGAYVNLDLVEAVTTVSEEGGWDVVMPAGGTNYKLAPGLFATEADAEAAFVAAATPPAPDSASFSGTVTYG